MHGNYAVAFAICRLYFDFMFPIFLPTIFCIFMIGFSVTYITFMDRILGTAMVLEESG